MNEMTDAERKAQAMLDQAHTPQMGCPVCGAVPDTSHSPHCDDPFGAGARLDAARREYESAMTGAQRAAIALVNAGWSEVQAAKAAGIDRMTLRKALGK